MALGSSSGGGERWSQVEEVTEDLEMDYRAGI